MPTIARGSITLSVLNDAFSVSLSPASRVVRAAFDGTVTDGELGNVFTNINVFRGDTPASFTVNSVTINGTGVTCSLQSLEDGCTQRLVVTSIPKDIASAEIAISISVGNDFHTTANFQFSVIRESSMLDWIQDWSGRRTEIRSESLVTPKAFFGSKTDDGRLNGVYIGPDMTGGDGIHAFKNLPENAFGNSSVYEIFRLNQNGGMIGGWEIDTDRIYKQTVTTDTGDIGLLELKAVGTLQFTKNSKLAWQLDKSGAGSFAFGNISWDTEGDAVFAGEITAKKGHVGGWFIGEKALYNNNVLISSQDSYIGVHASTASYTEEMSMTKHISASIKYGGVSMFYTSQALYGLKGYAPSPNKANPIVTFSLGSTNKIAGWSFDSEAIWIGSKLNQTRSKTSGLGSITIGTSGLRGSTWYIDNDGEISFMDGLLQFSNTGGKIGGWSISQHQMCSDYAGLVSHPDHTGLYLTGPNAFNGVYTGYVSHIQTNGGIYLRSIKTRSELLGVNVNGKVEFKLSTAEDNVIGGWKFNSTSIYSTQDITGAYVFAGANNIVISPEGIRGQAWRLEKDGSGALANGAISWSSDGVVTLGVGVTIDWNLIHGYGERFTKINSSGVYTGSINATQIQAGKISADYIDVNNVLLNEGKWKLGEDGSGYLAGKNITWTKDGELQITGKITATSGLIGGFQIVNTATQSSLETVEGAYDDGGYMKIISRGEVAAMFFRSSDFTKYAAVGVPAADSWSPYNTGYNAIMRLDNRSSSSRNVVLALMAVNGTTNYAFTGIGNGTLNGMIEGYATTILSRGKTDLQIPITNSNKFIISGNGTGGFILPTSESVRQALCPDMATNWSLKITIINTTSNTAKIKGRESNGSTSLPRIFNGSNTSIDYIDLEPGDAVEFLLWGSSYGAGYQAWVTSHQR